MATFAIGDQDFLLEGAPFQIIAGAIHYFRVHPDQWADRIHKAKLMGLNTIETYVAWNAHEPRRGEWDATGAHDLGRFLDLVAAEGMYAIVRPGPYICAEWHNGGLPVWLTGTRGIGLRRSEPQYIAEVTRFLHNVYDIVVPRQLDRGGNVILVQIENEYGAYGNDRAYLETLVEVTRDAGITVPLTTVDQPMPQMLRDGSLPGVHLTGSFGSRAAERLATLREHQSTGPLMCSEFWDGWFDWWGGVHHTTSAADAAAELETLLAAGASVNIYMFHGGTNFGLTSGANDKGRYLPLITSYDYDAPLDEAGDPTAKYHAFREVIARYAPTPELAPAEPAARPEVEAPLTLVGRPLVGLERDETRHAVPPTFDAIEHLGALVLYSIEAPTAGMLAFDEVRDLAWTSVDGVSVGTMSRTLHERAITIPRAGRIDVLVEEQGRVNYGPRLGEAKGLIGTPTLDGVPLEGWTATPIDLDELAVRTAAGSAADVSAAGDSGAGVSAGPIGLRGTFTLDAASDLFLDTEGWGKGYAFINGLLLGRYWSNGPQRTLYVPEPATHVGENEIVVIELEQMLAPTARFVASADLGPREE